MDGSDGRTHDQRGAVQNPEPTSMVDPFHLPLPSPFPTRDLLDETQAL
jgi:hypothetical protein